jgi:hypothetical protein
MAVVVALALKLVEETVVRVVREVGVMVQDVMQCL